MATYSDRKLMRAGAATAVALALAMVLAFNLQKLPGMKGTTYHARFADASGLHTGDRVEVAGVRVGRVDKITINTSSGGASVDVAFSVKDAKLGENTEASIEVLNLLGEKYLRLEPGTTAHDDGAYLDAGATIPLERTTAGYDIVGTLDQLTETTGKIDTDQLGTALNTVATTVNQAAPQVRGSFEGLARLSQTIASRDDDIDQLLQHAHRVVDLINQRKGDLIGLMKQGDQIFKELIQRRDDIHALLVNAGSLADQLRGLARDNEKQLGPALDELDRAITFLNDRKQQISDTIKYYGPYASILVNIIGTGPWFDAYVPNFASLATGEFVPGRRKGLD
ncbi:MAG: MCE family protein [Nocardioides sp.]